MSLERNAPQDRTPASSWVAHFAQIAIGRKIRIAELIIYLYSSVQKSEVYHEDRIVH